MTEEGRSVPFMDEHQRAHQSSHEHAMELGRTITAQQELLASTAKTVMRLTDLVERLTERVEALEKGERA